MYVSICVCWFSIDRGRQSICASSDLYIKKSRLLFFDGELYVRVLLKSHDESNYWR